MRCAALAFANAISSPAIFVRTHVVGAPGHDAGQIDEGEVFVDLPEPRFVLALASGLGLLWILRRRGQ